MPKKLLLLFSISMFLWVCFSFNSCSVLQNTVDYSTQIKPILNKHCIACHGGVKKQGGFSLLFENEAKAKSKSGKYAIVPGDASGSEMIRRLTLSDHEERMPYLKEPLGKEEIALLTKWVDQGAVWGEHWAYKPVKKQQIPTINDSFVQNDIDKFILEKAIENNLSISAKADPITLLRRLSLDVVGFPINTKTSENYIKSPNAKNFEIVVDSLLASKNYGEKWTSMWLDLARYADTKGYERDYKREIWRYRDWLINAFNNDMPYNQFITEQLAGDLLPNPSENQYIATAFHRNTMNNDEGGTENEEFRVAAVIDRVNTTWETLMGTTMACVQCHSHPYDPIKHEDYYRSMAFFNDSRDEDTFADYPILRHFNNPQQKKYDALGSWLNKSTSETEKNRILFFLKTLQPSVNSTQSDKYINADLVDTKWLAMRKNSSARFKNITLDGKSNLLVKFTQNLKSGQLKIIKDSLNGELLAVYNLEKNVPKEGISNTKEIPLKPTKGIHDLYFTYTNSSISDFLAYGITFDWLYFSAGFPATGSPGYIANKNVFWEILNAETTGTPIMLENPAEFKRETNVFLRGNWLAKGQKVNPGVPDVFNDFNKNMPTNRLGLANWIISDQNPLVARTIVNRVWEQIFGVGLVETLEDMGTQGANPTHKELLDHLSWKLMHDYKWSIKTLIKEIVMSGSYQQDSKFTKENLEKDPYNKYLARGPRVRLSAEQIRDQALAVSGVINPKMYGPPVMPYQPKGIWASPYDGIKWVLSENNDQYRRAVYTYWKRTSPYPSMITFDGVGREICTSRRIKTNTPLQALVTLNDSVYIDLSKQLARKVYFETNKNPEKSIILAYKTVTGKNISAEKLKVLKTLYAQTLILYKKEPELLRKLLSSKKYDTKSFDFGALILICNSILNLDEVITKS